LNTEALLKSYAELEKQFSSKSEEKVDDKSEEVVETETKDEDKTEDQAEEKVEDKTAEAQPLAAALEAAQAVYAETGELDAEARKPFLDAGYTDEHIDLYLAGVKAQTEGLKQPRPSRAPASRTMRRSRRPSRGPPRTGARRKSSPSTAQAADVETIGDAAKMLYQDFSEANPGEGRLDGRQRSHPRRRLHEQG
jgi:hypothetical protein